MLREIEKTRQHAGEPLRRWFHAQEQDLYVWQDEDGTIIAFQLCYDKPDNEHALYWRQDRGFSHLRVDDGENPAGRPQSPLLLADGLFDSAGVTRRFLRLAKNLPPEISRFVIRHLEQYHSQVPDIRNTR